ncbi:MAG: cysteine methyltransferase [Verrucomicrobia bacterium]|jgi:O-6-methylguanine DNA methyltransferase|nr:cysteine methyltransferase [Verrucomicrobiota bacterium]
MLSVHPISTPLGDFRVVYSTIGLASVDFPGQAHAIPPNLTAPSSVNLNQWHPLSIAALLAMTSGQAPKRLPPLDLSRGSEFQQAVWRELLAIPLGHTRTYGELAARLGNPSGSRAVGAACGANPIPVIVPCHRVLAANGKLGGFSGGAGWKNRLLQIEGVLLA